MLSNMPSLDGLAIACFLTEKSILLVGRNLNVLLSRLQWWGLESDRDVALVGARSSLSVFVSGGEAI
jgi:hypothetical protein